MQDSAGTAMAASAGPCASIPAEHMDFIRQVLDRVGDKWSMLIVAALASGPMRYTDLQRQIPGISQRMLTHTLRQLTEDGLTSRTAYAEVPPRVEYALTPLGGGLYEIVKQLIGWAADHHHEIRANRS
ncbi:transcriptional regulator [Nonomuraea longispora]|uniref:Transcriptional regulator n=2 Tax=Nonomuraea longispora TaxID=1848320 RepID=A0A4R4NHP8_9ACTN|nr:transcriptional regulator [Nonomuraea longispora]